MSNSAENPSLRKAFDKAIRLKRLGRTEQARRVLEQLQREHPESPAVLGYLGGVYFDDGDLEQATDCFRKTTELSPTSELASLGLFHSLWARKKRQAALAEMGRFLAVADSREYRTLIRELRLVPIVEIRESRPSLAS